MAVFDTNRFQMQRKQYAKFVFDCQLLDGDFQENQEVAELGFFDISALPPLSEKKNNQGTNGYSMAGLSG